MPGNQLSASALAQGAGKFRPRPAAKTPTSSAPLRPADPRLRCAAKAGNFAPPTEYPPRRLRTLRRAPTFANFPHAPPPAVRGPRRSKLRVTPPARPPPAGFVFGHSASSDPRRGCLAASGTLSVCAHCRTAREERDGREERAVRSRTAFNRATAPRGNPRTSPCCVALCFSELTHAPSHAEHRV